MKIAITGSIGSGKSEATRILREKGYHVFDCDEYNRFLLETDNLGYKYIEKHYPMVIKDKKIDKSLLANIIFNDDTKRKELEEYIHPLIIKEMLNESKKYDPFFAEVQLLFENNYQSYFDYSILIYAPKNICLERLIQRGLTRKDALSRMNKQMSVNKKKKLANKIIYNGTSLLNLQANIEEVLKELNVR